MSSGHAVHTPSEHKAVRQSLRDRQLRSTAQRGQLPPQSMSVSLPFWTPSVQVVAGGDGGDGGESGGGAVPPLRFFLCFLCLASLAVTPRRASGAPRTIAPSNCLRSCRDCSVASRRERASRREPSMRELLRTMRRRR